MKAETLMVVVKWPWGCLLVCAADRVIDRIGVICRSSYLSPHGLQIIHNFFLLI